MNHSDTDMPGELSRLFEQAEANGGLDYIYTLVRVTGITCDLPDPLVQLRGSLGAAAERVTGQEVASHYLSLAAAREPLELLANLIGCARGQAYDVSPFRALREGPFPDAREPSARQRAEDLAKRARDAGLCGLAAVVEEAYPADLLDRCAHWESECGSQRLEAAVERCASFLGTLVDLYFAERLKYGQRPVLRKLGGFRVLEFLVSQEHGLYGFEVHFPNGNRARFARHADSTECTNVLLRVPIAFWGGDPCGFQTGWRIRGKPLWEVGLPGRYNQLGEWKPVVYPGDCDGLQRDAGSQSDDPDVQGVLFYMMCTGHRVVEFAVRTPIDVPGESVRLLADLHLWKCPPPADLPAVEMNTRVYDGTWELSSPDPGDIARAVRTIGLALSRLAFTYQQPLDWRVKYRALHRHPSCALLGEQDLEALPRMLGGIGTPEELSYVDMAIDWWNLGVASASVLTAFLCYCIALEAIALPLSEGRMGLGDGVRRAENAARRKQTKACVERKHDELYERDPVGFVREAYSECVGSVKKEIRAAVARVFGPGSAQIETLLGKRRGPSLYDIRGKLAHGRVSALSGEETSVVRANVGLIREMSRAFLTRVMLGLKPEDPLPDAFPEHFRAGFLIADPRTTLAVSDERMLGGRDWRIRPEWCD